MKKTENQQARINNQELSLIFTAATPFVMARRKTHGGFGATPGLPATIEDTYLALNILNLARQYGAAGEAEFDSRADTRLHSYLDASRRLLAAGARTAFQLLWCRRAAGLELDRNAAKAAVSARMQATASLEDCYYSARILAETLDETLDEKSWPPAGARNLAVVLSQGWRSVDEAWMHLYLSWKCRAALPQPAPELIAWFRACQNGDGGFGFFPGTTSFTENCYVCLRALAFLDAAPLQPNLACRFLTGCQTISGGFGRSSRAAPFLDATWPALAGIALINS